MSKKPDWIKLIDSQEEQEKEIPQEGKEEEIQEERKNNKKSSESTSNIDQESEDLDHKIKDLLKQSKDHKEWGMKNRTSFILAKKRITDFAKKMLDEGNIFEDHVKEINDIFERSTTGEDVEEDKKDDDPFTQLTKDLNKTFEEYKKWSEDDTVDLKYQSFFKHLELTTPKKIKDIQDYLLEETPQKALKYILEKGGQYYDKFYKHALSKGDAFGYIEELTLKNEKLEKKVKDLEEELDSTQGTVYSKSIKPRGSYSSSVITSPSRWGDSGKIQK